MAPSTSDKIIKERESVAHTISYLEKKIVDHATTALTIVKADQLLETVAKNQEKIEDTFERLVAICDPADVDDHRAEYESLSDRALEVKCQLFTIKRSLAPTSSSSSSSGAHPGSTSDIRLPRITLPIFEGQIEAWTSFRDMFTTAIINNTSLSNAQRLTYLKAQLKGEAARQVQSLSISDANFDIAWQQLEDRYQNDRQILFAILKRLMTQPTLSNPSASSIRQIIDVSNECMRSLNVLKQPVKDWDSILLYIIYQKLDTASKEQYEQTLKDSSVPKLKGLFDYMEQRSRALEAGGSAKPHHQDRNRIQPQRNNVHHAQSQDSNPCKVCNQVGHQLFRCSKFLAMSVQERTNQVKLLKLCFNCLRSDHIISKCTTTATCKSCGARHHTLLHRLNPSQQTQSTTPVSKATPSLTHHTTGSNTASQTLLATAVIHVLDSEGERQPVRVLLDGGSDTHVISTKCVKRLGLKWTRQLATVTGLSSTPVGTSLGFTDIELFPHFGTAPTIQAKSTRIMPTVTCSLPLHPCNPDIAHLYGLQLADDQWHQPGEIDMLIGATLFYAIMKGDKICGRDGEPIAFNSDLGWLVVGEVESSLKSHHSFHSRIDTDNQSEAQTERVEITDVDLDRTLRSFWELETLPDSPPLTLEEKACEQHFASTHTQQATGRFTVRLPFKTVPPAIGPSRDIAVQRLKQLERRFTRQPQHKTDYVDFMRTYLSMGHMEEIPQEQINSNQCCYIPHHFVIKESSTTTQLRVVFDASCKTANGKSLNDSLMVGATIQDPLIDILLRFRTHVIAFTADIAKMYRQIKVDPEDAEYTRIVWREDPSSPIRDYRLLTVTYGTAPAPFLATRSLQQLARNNQQQFPLASAVALKDFYVDDCMSGANSLPTALDTQSQLLSLMQQGGFELRKWSSSHPALLQSLPEELKETKSLLPVELGHAVKALGIFWKPETDEFFFKIDNSDNNIPMKSLTKRIILSQIAKIFDPVGWLAPVIITAKITMQSLWKLELGWDDPVPVDLHQMWTSYKAELKHLESLHIPRCICPCPDSRLALIGFCDASEKAYAAVIYLAVYPTDLFSPHISLIASKTRVAPSKPVSLPRLELCGAVLLSNLMDSVRKALQLNLSHISAWTDSTVTLAWIQSHPSRWKRFVADRVTSIQELLPSNHWGHVAGKDNPADSASRGIDPHTFTSYPLWWNGPSWLKMGIPELQDKNFVFGNKNCLINHTTFMIDSNIDMEEKREKVILRIQTQEVLPLMNHVSSLTRLTRTTAWILRFKNNLFARIRNRKAMASHDQPKCRLVESPEVGSLALSECGLGDGKQCTTGSLLPLELTTAMLYWVRIAQREAFAKDIASLEQSLPLSHKSPLLNLAPFLDTDGVLRVGGRLRKSKLGFERKHPLILSHSSNLTKMLIIAEHERYFHAGPTLLLSLLRFKYWITRGPDTIRFQLKKCVVCAKQRATTMQQQMGDLPEHRVVPSRAFSKCGVDYAGPFQLKPMSPRSKSTIKSYICLFVCFTTKALHLELVSSLSTDAFVAAMKRFIARRGKPSDIHSDCGTNFIGAARELRELYAHVNEKSFNETLSDQLSQEEIKWHFNPPSAPHFGGLWEAGVKSVKFHLRKVMGNVRLNYEEFATTITQIEAVLNSRPLIPISSDPDDFGVLTPGHFLIGTPLHAPPEHDITHLNPGRLNRWQLIQQMYQLFWQRWSREYLSRMQQRPKWMQVRESIQVGDLVTIKDDNLPPLRWRLGRVMSIHPGSDGQVRVVTLKTANGTLTRPIVKLCLLPIDKPQGQSNHDSV